MDFDPDHIVRSPFSVGAVGALITAVKFTPSASWAERAFNVGVARWREHQELGLAKAICNDV
jgi:hypothetical protein